MKCKLCPPATGIEGTLTPCGHSLAKVQVDGTKRPVDRPAAERARAKINAVHPATSLKLNRGQRVAACRQARGHGVLCDESVSPAQS